ncbi:hypothetical protein [Mesorhizobium sp.]|uniref:hypothetical protein n=1 Tax=Mesorhizobium sp. TaxID=1871066 RepID=UPI000FE38CB3|nr:hypothetical protein [Mesorhizobium sp.]RWJ03488.1 MAG: hypothetical protein EOR24_32425 [Mesorhizobium sp.]
MTMILLLAATGAIVVFASYWSKWDTQKRMKKLREEEKTFKDKVSKFRAKEMSVLEDVASAVTVRGVDLGPSYEMDFNLLMARSKRFRFGGGNVVIVGNPATDAPPPRRPKAQAAPAGTKGRPHG